MSRNFAEILAHKRILLCVGSGGVGKTTTAAALALEAARRGIDALVLTIDPAKRLANSLGLSALGHAVQRVPDELLAAAGPRAPGGALHAMMLDQKRAFDDIVERHATDPAAVKRILANPVYEQISSTLAGSQEYAAMAVVNDLAGKGQHDLYIVDTPPTAHALDFLDAPQKLTEAIDSPAIEWFRKMRGQGGAASGWSVVGRTGSYVLKRLAKFVGARFLDDLAVFFTDFNDILGGFRERARETFSLLRRPDVGFVLVATPEEGAVQEALFFHQRLVTASMPLAGFVVNRVHDDRPVRVDAAGLAEKLAQVPQVAALGYQPTTLRMTAEGLLESHRDLQVLAVDDRREIARLRAAAGDDALVVEVPFFRDDIHDVAGLSMLGRYLVS